MSKHTEKKCNIYLFENINIFEIEYMKKYRKKVSVQA